MPDNSALILNCLINEIKLIKILISILSTEENALVCNNLDELKTATIQKKEVLDRINQFSLQREKLFSDLTCYKSRNFASWIESHNDSKLKSNWLKLLALVNESKSKNETNGLLINQLNHMNSKALSFFQGQSSSLIYGPNGLKK